jgi:hypothetical protein
MAFHDPERHARKGDWLVASRNQRLQRLSFHKIHPNIPKKLAKDVQDALKYLLENEDPGD